MKKLLTLLLILLLMLGLGACNSNESNDSTTNQDTQEQTTTQEETKQEVVDTDVQQKEIDNKEESKEEVKEETIKEIDSEVLKTYKYWVVFYDQCGNELQREALKYGTVPTYYSDVPYFDDGTYWYKGIGWTDKWGREVKEFKPIAGNTKFYAKYEKCGEVSHSSGGGESNPPAPTPAHVCANTSTYLLHILSMSLPFDIYADVYEWDSVNQEYSQIQTNYHIDGLQFNPMPSSSDVWIHTNNYDHPYMGNQQYCDDYEAHTLTCFVAGTQVQYDLLGHTKNIEDFKVGDQIVSYDVNNNKYYLAKVGKVFIHDGNERVSTLVDVVLEDGSIITMTPNHPVYTTVGFRAVDNEHMPKLFEKQFVMTTNGWIQIKEIKVFSCEPTVTYNLGIIDYDETVDDDTYDTYVAGGVVVHNIY